VAIAVDQVPNEGPAVEVFIDGNLGPPFQHGLLVACSRIGAGTGRRPHALSVCRRLRLVVRYARAA
jgi:hypothetical protein